MSQEEFMPWKFQLYLGTSLLILLGCQGLAAQQLDRSDYDCLIEPSITVELGSAVSGVAEEVLVERGDVVSEGDVLVRLESGVQQAAVDLARARSENTAELSSRAESMKLARKLHARIEGLYEDNNISQQQMEEAESEASIAESNWHQARENKILAELELKQSQQVLAMRTIKSPISGMLVERMISPGELVDDDQPIMRLASLNPLHVEVIMPASRFGEVQRGSAATVMPAEPIGGAYEGRVDIVDNIIDAASGTFGVRIKLPNPDESLPAGLGCEVEFLPTESP